MLAISHCQARISVPVRVAFSLPLPEICKRLQILQNLTVNICCKTDFLIGHLGNGRELFKRTFALARQHAALPDDLRRAAAP